MMKKLNYLYLFLSATMLFVIVESCSKDDDDDDDQPMSPSEFIANDNTFVNYKSWPVRSTTMGPDPGIGDAHGDNDSTVTRTTYVKDGQDAVNGVFPQGTVIVKTSENTSGTLKEYTGMVKRGGNFNSTNNGWEWFVLNEDGSIFEDGNGIELRGGDLFECTSCHSFAPVDYVYTEK